MNPAVPRTPALPKPLRLQHRVEVLGSDFVGTYVEHSVTAEGRLELFCDVIIFGSNIEIW